MPEENALIPINDDLLNIFPSEDDKRGNDLLAMSDFFGVYIGKIQASRENEAAWEVLCNVEGLVGEIATAIKGGFDISKIGMLVADYSHFSQEIIDGLKSGLYHVGQSKEVAGNMRPAILDENERLVKFFTLKKAKDPSLVLGDISTLSMQIYLQQITSQIEEIGRDVKSLINFERREVLSNKFLYARDKILQASKETGDEREICLKEADTYLMEGLTDLYSDLHDQVKELAKISGPFAKLKSIDTVLTYINEDMQMIPRYVGLRVYLFNLRGKTESAKEVLAQYRYNLQSLAEKPVTGNNYTALQLIHKNYPYDLTNVDFWLEKPPLLISAIDSYQQFIEQKNPDVYYIDAGERDEIE